MSVSTEDNLSRIYTINLGKARLTPRYRRTDRVVNMIREFARKHMKSNEVKLDQELNRHVWKRGKAHPPRRLRVRMTKDEDGIVIISPYEEAVKKDDDISSASDEQAESKPEQEPLPVAEKIREEKPEEQPEAEETELTTTKKGTKKSDAKSKRVKKARSRK
jgi:large subunit ribosomal protein L31e